MTINSPKLERYIAAYNAGAPRRELGTLIGLDGTSDSSMASIVSHFNGGLISLGVVAKRKRLPPVILHGSEADEYRAWKASRAAPPNGAAAE